jgi:cell division protein FtsL
MSLAYSNTNAARAPKRSNETAQPTLRLIVNGEFNRALLGNATMRAVIVFIVGAILVILTGLQLSIMIQQGSYQLAGLKTQMKDLTITNQILDEQVRSLSSDQNLANAAASLGMVTNANPVYLRLEDGKVIGHPKVASSNSGVKIGKNVVPNAALVAVTTKAALEASTQAALRASNAAKAAAAASAEAALHPAVSPKGSSANSAKGGANVSTANADGKPVKSNVAADITSPAKVVLATSGIPVSPTH